jgi:peptide chain release factor subunit 1
MIGGWSQARYQRHIDNYYLHHAKDVIAELDWMTRQEQIRWIVLAGDEVIIPVLRDQLPQRLAERVIAVLRLEMDTPDHEVMRKSLEAVRARDAREDSEKVAKLLEEYLGEGFAVTGANKTLMALTLGQVEEMMISASFRDLRDDLEGDGASFISTVLAASNGEARLAAIADELVARARQTGAQITFIEDAARLAECGGVGAKLRFRL